MGLITLTPADKAMLESIKPVVDGIATISGNHTEVLLHSLDKNNPSVIKIANGHITGRTEGAPVTDLAMSKLVEGQDVTPSYFTQTADGKMMRSVTTVIRNPKGQAIALLCINVNLDAPFREVVSSMIPTAPAEKGHDNSPENFAKNLDDLLNSSVTKAIRSVESDDQVLPSLKNKAIIERLFHQGIFELKEAIQFVADHLCISHHTVYRHLRELKSRC